MDNLRRFEMSRVLFLAGYMGVVLVSLVYFAEAAGLKVGG